MKLATTTGDFTRYCAAFEEKIRHVHKAGFRYIDVSFYQEANSTASTMQSDWKEQMYRLKDLAAELDIEYVQAHSPGGNPLAHDQNWEILLASTIRSIECCEILGIPNTVVHSGWTDDISKDEFFRKNLEFYSLLFPAMEKYGINVLIENSTRANMGSRYYFYTGADMKEFIEYANHPLLHACWDTGHANVEGHQYQDLVDLGKDLYALHINDNRGQQDEHINPFCGTMSIDEVMNGILDAGYQGVFTMECDSTLRPANYWLGNRYAYPQDQRLLNPSIELADAAERLLFETGKHILKSYNLWEE